MALIYSGIECAICHQVISDELLDARRFVATTHFIGDSLHPLSRFSDAAMHRHCFVNWEHRKQFAQLYNDTVGKLVWGDGTHRHMSQDGDIASVRSED